MPVSFIIGCSITPKYSYYGQRIAPGKTVEIKDFFISLGPVCGFSVYKSDFFEFYSLIGIKLGLPIYSELKYPDESAEELNHFSINGIIRNEINFYIRRINIGLGYSFYLDGDFREWVTYNLLNAVRINLLLCVFNLIPLPPLDGGRVAVGLLPPTLAQYFARLERFGFIILLGALFLLPYLGRQVGVDLNIFAWLVGAPTEYLMRLLLTTFGLI